MRCPVCNREFTEAVTHCNCGLDIRQATALNGLISKNYTENNKPKKKVNKSKAGIMESTQNVISESKVIENKSRTLKEKTAAGSWNWSIIIAALIVAASLVFYGLSNRYYIESSTELKVDKLTGITYRLVQTTQGFKWVKVK